MLKISFFLCLATVVNAQSNYVDAVVYKNNGDSIKGQINYQEWFINPDAITFKAANAIKTQEFRPKDIAKFVIKSKDMIYESSPINVINQTLRDLEAQDASLSIKDALESLKFRKDTAFLSVLEKGKASLYLYVDNNSIEHYFVRKDQGKPVELLNVKMKIIEDKKGLEVSRISYLYLEDYKTRLKELTSDYPKLAKEIDRMGLFESDISYIINSYNDLAGKNEFSQKKGKNSIQYYVTTGLSLPKAHVNAFGLTTVISGKPTIPIGVGLELKAKKGLDPMRLGAELSWAYNVYDKEISISDRVIKHEARLQGLHFTPYLKASFYSKKMTGYSAYCKLGVTLSYYLKANYKVSYLVPVNFFEPDVYKVDKTSGVAMASVGFKMKKWFSEVKIEPYSLNLVRTDSPSDYFQTIRYGFVVGYLF